MHENDYLNELRAGKQLRIKYNKKNYDGCDDEGWGSEELLMYDRAIDLFKCYYPKSSYEKDFCTCHTEREAKSFIRDAIWSSEHEDGDAAIVTDIILEECNIPISSLSVRELAMEKINNMTDDELRKIFLL